MQMTTIQNHLEKSIEMHPIERALHLWCYKMKKKEIRILEAARSKNMLLFKKNWKMGIWHVRTLYGWRVVIFFVCEFDMVSSIFRIASANSTTITISLKVPYGWESCWTSVCVHEAAHNLPSARNGSKSSKQQLHNLQQIFNRQS